MKGNLENAIKLTFGSEGGYVDHPLDPGGPTKFGITLATLANYRHTEVTAADVKALGLSEAAAILDMQYWRKIWGDDLPRGVDYAMFDYAVNSGPAQAVKAAQKILGMDRDGIMGAFTLNALRTMDPELFIASYMAARLDFLKGLSTWSTFGHGWSARVEHVRRASLAMLEKTSSVVAGKVAPKDDEAISGNANAPPRDTRTSATPQGQASITATAGSITGAIVTGSGFLVPYADNPTIKTWLILFAIVCAAVTIGATIAGLLIERRQIAHGSPQ